MEMEVLSVRLRKPENEDSMDLGDFKPKRNCCNDLNKFPF